MKLEFEMLESNDGHYAKRAPVPGGFVYLFTDWDNERGCSRATATCFVPSEPEANEYGERGAEQLTGAITRGLRGIRTDIQRGK